MIEKNKENAKKNLHFLEIFCHKNQSLLARSSSLVGDSCLLNARVTAGVTGMEERKSGALGVVAALFMIVSYCVSIATALAVHYVTKPGDVIATDAEDTDDDSGVKSYTNLWFDILR